MPVKRKGKGISRAKLENAQKRGLILAAKVVAQRATNRAHVQTGRLKRSITHSQVHQIGRDQFGIDIGTNVEYAEEEELRPGTKDGTTHSFLRPALQESKDTIVKILTKSVIGALKQ